MNSSSISALPQNIDWKMLQSFILVDVSESFGNDAIYRFQEAAKTASSLKDLTRYSEGALVSLGDRILFRDSLYASGDNEVIGEWLSWVFREAGLGLENLFDVLY